MSEPEPTVGLTREERERLATVAVYAASARHTGTPVVSYTTVDLADYIYQFLEKKVTGA